MENPSGAPRAEGFPVGLRVLVVDDDPTWLKILEKMLRKCSYEVTTCGLARKALDLLRERKDKFDIVISDVNMPDMDGFKLLEQVGLEMDLPVIMMSVDGETSRVMKGVQHGACDYLLKPVRMKELKNIWQHVFRKRIHEMRDVESFDSNDIHNIMSRFEELDEWQIHTGVDVTSAKKRKDIDKDHYEHEVNDTASVKKARVVWSVELHQKFVNAVNQIGFEKVGPKRILDLMNVPGLTRENVASHLQKYRLYLSRLQKQKEGNTVNEIVKSDLGSNNLTSKFGMQNSISTKTSGCPDSLDFPAIRSHHQQISPGTCAEDLQSIPSFQVTDTRKGINARSTAFQSPKYDSDFGVITSPEDKVLRLGNNYNEICISNPCLSGINEDATVHPVKQDQGAVAFMKTYSQLQKSVEERHTEDHNLHAPHPMHMLTSNSGEKYSQSHVKPACSHESNHDRNIPSTCNIDLVSLRNQNGVLGAYNFDATPNVKNFRDTNAYSYGDRGSICSRGSHSQMLNLKAETDFSPLHELFPYPFPSYGCFDNSGFNSLEKPKYDQVLLPALQDNLYDELQYSCDYLFDLLDLPTVENGLLT